MTNALIELYIRHLQARHLCPTTLRRQNLYFHHFLAWLDNQGKTDLREVTFQNILDYQSQLSKRRKTNGESLSIAYQHYQIHSIAALFQFLKNHGKILLNPCADLPPLRKPRRLPRGIITAAQVLKLLQQPNLLRPCGFRDRCILELLYSCGLRGLELCRLTLYDIDFDKRLVRIVQGKGKKDRLVPVGKIAAQYLHQYLHHIRPFHQKKSKQHLQHFFLTAFGTALCAKHLRVIFQNHRKAAGLPDTVTVHSLRHACATGMLRGGASVRHVQEMLGHNHLSTTQIYTHVVPHDLQRIHARTAPSEKRKLVRVPVFKNHGWKDSGNRGHY